MVEKKGRLGLGGGEVGYPFKMRQSVGKEEGEGERTTGQPLVHCRALWRHFKEKKKKIFEWGAGRLFTLPNI